MQCPLCFQKDACRQLVCLSVTSLYRCRFCRVVFVDPNFQNEEEDFFDTYQVDQWLRYYRPFRSRSHRLFLKRHRQYFSSVRSVLDVGCAAGWFLDAIKKDSLKTVGVEPSPAMAGRINKSHDLYPISADQIGQIEGSFDLISFWNVFEHLANPHQMLKLVSQKLTPKGWLILSVPNQDGLISRLAYLLNWTSTGLVRLPLEELFQTDNAFGHVFHYNRSSLEFFLNRHGFTPLVWEGADIVDTTNVRQRLKISPNHLDEVKQQVVAVFISCLTRLARVTGFQDELVVIARKS